jgi:hypothetical protein
MANIWRVVGDHLELARDMDAFAEVMVTAAPANAIALSGAADKLRRDRSAVPFPVECARLESWQLAARRQIGEGAFDYAHLKGQTMSLQDALDLCASDVPAGPAS